MTRVILVGADDRFVSRMNVLPGTQIIALDADRIESKSFDLMRSLDPESLPDLIMFCDKLAIETALALAAEAEERFPSIDLILVGEHAPDVAVDAMRAGIRDMVEPDSAEEQFVEIMRRAEKTRAPAEQTTQAAGAAAGTAGRPEHSRTITVVSPKGGVGKTSISTNLAIGLAEKMPQDVVLVDLDLQFGDVAATLDLVPSRTMEDALGTEAAVDTLVLKTMLAVHPAGFFVLCGAESPAANENVTGSQVLRLLQQLSSQFSCIIVDTAAGLDEPTLAALEATDDVVIVSTMDVACVRSVRREVDLLVYLGLLPQSRTLALNLADRRSGMKVKDVEAVVGLPVDIVIPRSSDVQLAANHGQPLMLRKKRGGPFVKAVSSMIERLHGKGEGPDSKHKRLEVA
ncbi:CpaE family protein [Aeromicrobium sp. CF4.19]|uniref:AAA family ATPase n=1 Tax=Aeromicrobium sp. CF4.19 TaxID=3373082 RepID=UPI003EE43224